MFWSNEKWAVGVSYPGSDPQLDAKLLAIATQHGGTRRVLGVSCRSCGLGFDFRTRVAAESARSEMLASRPGVIVATVQPLS
jgi:hypothetical protein